MSGSFISATAFMVPSTLAAPDMSNFISSISGAGFSEMPPVSKVMPLPTSTIGLFVGLAAGILEDDELGRLVRALGDREQAHHAQLFHVGALEDFDGQPMFLGHRRAWSAR